MKNLNRFKIKRDFILLYIILVFPSLYLFAKYLNLYYLGLYTILAFIILHVFFLSGAVYLKKNLSERLSFYLVGFTILFLFICFVIVYPLLDAGTIGGGSDSDQALNSATTELLNGRYPYHVKTYLGNPVSPMPGSLIFAAPFVILGNSAYQNFFWLILFLVVVKKHLLTNLNMLFLLWATILFSPSALHILFTGSDYLANSLFILILSLTLIQFITEKEKKFYVIPVAIILGIAFSSRANFIFILPVLFSYLTQISGFKKAFAIITIVILSSIAITLPFYLYDPEGFSPLHTVWKLKQFENVIPYISIIVPLVTLLFSIFLSLRKIKTVFTFLGYCTAVIAVPILFTMTATSINAGRIDFNSTTYGMYFLFFGALAFWPRENLSNKITAL